MTTLELAAKRVQDRADYCHRLLPAWSPTRLLAHAAFEYTVGHVSAPEYGFEALRDGMAADPETILTHESGICGHAGIVMQAILEQCGVPSRHVEIYSASGGGHVAVEAGWHSRWHYFDPTWGFIYVRQGAILGLQSILRMGGEAGKYRVAYRSHLWADVVSLIPEGPQKTGLAALDDPVYVTSGGVVYLDRRDDPDAALAKEQLHSTLNVSA